MNEEAKKKSNKVCGKPRLFKPYKDVETLLNSVENKNKYINDAIVYYSLRVNKKGA